MPIIVERPSKKKPKAWPRTDLIALRALSGTDGRVARFSHFSAAGARVARLLRKRLAIEDVSEIGLSNHGLLRLGQLGLNTRERLRAVPLRDAEQAGLPDADLQALRIWRGEAAEKAGQAPSPSPNVGSLDEIPGVGPKVLEQLRRVGIETPDDLLAAPSEMLDDMRLGAALAKIQAWREGHQA